MKKILIKFPTRQRPKLFRKILSQYRNLLSGKNEVEFIISMDSDDRSMNNLEIRKMLDKKNLKYFYGNSKSKIEAINCDLGNVDFDILLLASDDMTPKIKGYDEVIIKNMKKYFTDTDGVLHFNDGRMGIKLNSFPIMGRKYYDRFGYIYHPDYTSFYCDEEFQRVSERMKKSVYIDKIIFKHDWKGPEKNIKYKPDDLYLKNEKFFKQDRNIFKQRVLMGFPLDSISNYAEKVQKENAIRKETIKSVRKKIEEKKFSLLFRIYIDFWKQEDRIEKFVKPFVSLSSGNYNILIDLIIENRRVSRNINIKNVSYVKNIKIIRGTFASKTDAFNSNITRDFDILIPTHNKMSPSKKGYDEVIVNSFVKHFPDLKGVIQFKSSKHGVFFDKCIGIGRRTYNKNKYVFSDQYKHIYHDEDLIERCRVNDNYIYVNNKIMNNSNLSTQFSNPAAKKIFASDKRIFDNRKYRVVT
jgi:hypothetical protein